MPDGVRADVALDHARAPKIGALDLHSVAHVQVKIAEARLRAVARYAVRALAEAPDADTEAKPRRAARREREASRSIGDASGKPKSDRHGSWDKRVEKEPCGA